MNRILALIIGVFVTLPAFAGTDRSVTVEYIFGFGGSAPHKGFAVRYGQDNVEASVAHWFGPRENTALGLGLVANSEGSGELGNDDYNLSATAGIAYVFEKNAVLTSHVQPFFRAAGNADMQRDGNVEVEMSYLRYGFLRGENFGGIGLVLNDRFDNDNPVASSFGADGSDGSDGSNGDNGDDGNGGDTPPTDPPTDPPPVDPPTVPPVDPPPVDPPTVPPVDPPPVDPPTVPPVDPPPVDPPVDGDRDRGHGNEEDGCDPDNTGNKPGCNLD